MKLNCPYVTCKFNDSNLVGGVGLCTKDEITLKAIDLMYGEEAQLLDCPSYWYESNKNLTHKE